MGAGRPLRVRWAFEEAGAPYDWVEMDREVGRGPEHARRHPLGRVPVLETDDGLLFESAALCLHVADSHPAASLISAPGTHERALAYQWSFFAMTELEPAVLRAYMAREGSDETKQQKAYARVAQTGETVVAALSDGRHLLEEFNVADILVGGVLHSARQYELLPDSQPLRDYLERLDARPAKQRAYGDG